ncbi:hypothetical protein VTN96DRAFT_4728 [Rasamsonia emersonii]
MDGEKVAAPIDESNPAETGIVDFEKDDPANPLNWPKPYKWAMVILVACLSAMVQLSTIIAAPVSPQILTDFHSDNTLYRTLIVSIWELGEIVGPLVWGPLSEVYGRRPVLNIANFFFVAFFVGTVLSTNIQILVAFRFLSGTATAASPIGPGIVRDLFAEEHRGRAMSIMSMSTALGPLLGPIVGSYLGQNAGWRWTFWLPTIAYGFLSLLFLAVYRETYKVSILEKKTRQRQRETGDYSLRSKYETDDTALRKLYKTAIRPLSLLVRSPALMLITLFICIVYGYTYLIMTTIAPVFQDVYAFSEGASGLAFLGLCLGLVSGSILCSFLLDHYVQLAKKRAGAITPEQRLPPVLVACMFMPGGLFLFGWSTAYHVQFIVPIIGTAVIGFALAATSISLQSYIVDAFGIYAVSAVSAMLVPRNATAAFLPLAGPPLYSALGYGWGNSVLGFIALAFVPMPLLFMKFGERIRKCSAHLLVE